MKENTYIVIARNGLNLRNQPLSTDNSYVIKKLPFLSKVNVVKDVGNGWSYVRYRDEEEDFEGYCWNNKLLGFNKLSKTTNYK